MKMSVKVFVEGTNNMITNAFQLPRHLFVACDGDLLDTRRADWTERPLRHGYARQALEFPDTPAGNIALRATIRNPFAWPGGYEIFFVTTDGGALCRQCARKEYRQIVWDRHKDASTGWHVWQAASSAETDDSVVCDHCNRDIVEEVSS